MCCWWAETPSCIKELLFFWGKKACFGPLANPWHYLLPSPSFRQNQTSLSRTKVQTVFGKPDTKAWIAQHQSNRPVSLRWDKSGGRRGGLWYLKGNFNNQKKCGQSHGLWMQRLLLLHEVWPKKPKVTIHFIGVWAAGSKRDRGMLPCRRGFC